MTLSESARRNLAWLLRGIVLFAVAGCTLAATGTPTEQTPPKRAHHAIVFDASRGESLVFGGGTAPANPGQMAPTFQDVWSFDGKNWRHLADTGLPRVGHRLLYDAQRKRVLMIGSTPSPDFSGETRMLVGQQWRVVDGTKPIEVSDAAVAYDTRRKRAVLFGGMRVDKSASRETWEFDGKDWALVAQDGPPAVYAASAVFDEARGVTVLFGGGDAQRKLNADTWQWDGKTWKRLDVVNPPARASAGFAYDAARKQAVLFGGVGAAMTRVPNTTWIWDGKQWEERTVPGPSARSMPQMTFDSRRSVIVLFGGRLRYPVDDGETWEWDGTQWKQVAQ